jgi:transposase-like protein
MHGMRRQHDAAVKAKVALEAIKGEKTVAQIAGEYGIHPNQIRLWRDRALAALTGVFSKGAAKSEKEHTELEEELYRQIGRLKVENDWLKKKSQQLR